MSRLLHPRYLLLAVLVALPMWLSARCGEINYSLHAQSLKDAADFVQLTFGSAVLLLQVLATMIGIYQATVINFKLTHGEEGFAKHVTTFALSVLFLVASIIFLPSLFGMVEPNAGSSIFDQFRDILGLIHRF